MTSEVTGVSQPDFDRIINRLLARLKELEATAATTSSGSADGPAGISGTSDGLRGVRANQLDARGNKGGIWYVVESRWSIVAIAIACVALGISIASGGAMLSKLVEVSRELSREERLKTAAIDELRMENRAVLRAAGVPSEHLEDHDISGLAEKAVKGKP